MHNPEADEIDPQDLEAAADMYDQLVQAHKAPALCPCLEPGVMNSGIPGILANGERCDICKRFHDDDTARLVLTLTRATEAMLDVQSARRHPLGAPDEGIAYMAAQAAANARDAIKAAKGTP